MGNWLITCTFLLLPSCLFSEEVVGPLLHQDFLKKIDRQNRGVFESCSGDRSSCFVEWSPEQLKAGETYYFRAQCISKAAFFSGLEHTLIKDANGEVLYNKSDPLVCRGLKSKLEFKTFDSITCPMDANSTFQIVYEVTAPEYFPFNAMLGTYNVHWQITNDLNQVVICLQGFLTIVPNIEIDDEE